MAEHKRVEYRLPIEFKTADMQKQFDLHGSHDKPGFSPKLRAIILEMAYYAWRYIEKTIVITDVIRNDKTSVHRYGRGCDVRTHNFTDGEQLELETHLNEYFPYGNHEKPWIKTCSRHDVGSGFHFHLQVKPGS